MLNGNTGIPFDFFQSQGCPLAVSCDFSCIFSFRDFPVMLGMARIAVQGNDLTAAELFIPIIDLRPLPTGSVGRHHIDGETLGLKGGHVLIRGNRIHMLGLGVLVLHVVDFHILHIGQGGILNFHGNRFVRLPFIPLAVIDGDVIGSQDRQVLQRNLHRLGGHIGALRHQAGHGNLRIVIRHRSNGIIFPN